MSKTITLSLKKDLILEAAKADTFQAGLADKSDNPVTNAARAFVKQAGGEQYQERMLLRYLRSGLAKFASMMSEFVDAENGSIKYNLKDDSNDITMVIVVSDRYNDGLAQPLSSFAEDFVVYNIDFMWWQSINPGLAKDYKAYAEDAFSYVRTCLAKTAPEASSASYTDITGTVEKSTTPT